MAAMMTFAEKYGCEPDLAAKASLALHPLDDSPVPSRAYEKPVRKASRHFARSLRRLVGKPDEIETLTMRTLQSYKDLAVQLGETHYVSRYNKALGLTE
jgi:hypothetical protein